MGEFFAILFLVSLILLFIGLFAPNKSLFWYKKERTVRKSTKLYGIALIAFFILTGITASDKNADSTNNKEQQENTDPQDDNISRERQQAQNEILIRAEAKRVADSTYEADSKNLQQWTIVKTWKGSGIKKTEPFTISNRRWRIIWSYTSASDACFMQIWTQRPTSDAPEDLVANVANEASGGETSYFYNQGEFYIDVNAADCNWKIIVEEETNH